MLNVTLTKHTIQNVVKFFANLEIRNLEKTFVVTEDHKYMVKDSLSKPPVDIEAFP